MTGIPCPVCGSEPLVVAPDTTRPPGLPPPPYKDLLLGPPPYEVCPNCGAPIVEFDEEAQLQKEAAWAEIELPRFTIVGWSAVSIGRRGTSIFVAAKRVATSDGWAYRDGRGRLIEVEVVRADGPSIAEEQQRAIFNTLYPYARASQGDDIGSYEPEVERVKEAIRSGALAWRTESFLVDDVRTSFETLNLGHEFWIAAAQLSDCIVTVKSHGVRRDEVALTRADAE
jgi:hypothetical protein